MQRPVVEARLVLQKEKWEWLAKLQEAKNKTARNNPDGLALQLC